MPPQQLAEPLEPQQALPPPGQVQAHSDEQQRGDQAGNGQRQRGIAAEQLHQGAQAGTQDHVAADAAELEQQQGGVASLGVGAHAQGGADTAAHHQAVAAAQQSQHEGRQETRFTHALFPRGSSDTGYSGLG